MPRKKTTKRAGKKQKSAASLKLRIGGFIADYILLYFIRALIAIFFTSGGVYSVSQFFALPVVVTLLTYLYFIVATYMTKGATVGKILVGTTVVSVSGELTLIRIVIRYTVLFLLISGVSTLLQVFNLFNIDGVGIIQVIIDVTVLVLMIVQQEHRGVHDLIAGTKVVTK